MHPIPLYGGRAEVAMAARRGRRPEPPRIARRLAGAALAAALAAAAACAPTLPPGGRGGGADGVIPAAPTGTAASSLQAIAELIARGELGAARALLEQWYTRPMSLGQRRTLQLHRARIAQALGEHTAAMTLLRQIRSVAVSKKTRATLLYHIALSERALGHWESALDTLIERDSLLTAPQQVANQRDILALIQALGPLHRTLLKESTPRLATRGWIALGEALEQASSARTAAIARWRGAYPDHPAQVEWLSGAAATPGHRHIALLLPLTSPFGQAARAFHEGFMAAHAADFAAQPPQVLVHDIGENAAFVAQYYRDAQAAGADFVVGPLGRKGVDRLLDQTPLPLPTLVVGEVPPGKDSQHLYGISLSPEQEAIQVAERAYADGHRQTALLAARSPWGERVSAAFMARWEALGGRVVHYEVFHPREIDYARPVRRLLDIDESITRRQQIAAEIGVDVKFTPRRRDDMDFLFLAANAEQARLLVPQLRFLHAHDLRLYATSHVYSGMPNPANDTDLDGIIFGDMAWMLGGADRHPRSPYYRSHLDRLYALGMESYRLIPKLLTLRDHPDQHHLGTAMSISVQPDGNARPHLTWARFHRGVPMALPPRAIP